MASCRGIRQIVNIDQPLVAPATIKQPDTVSFALLAKYKF